MIRPLSLLVLDGSIAICRLEASAAIPTWAATGSIFSITRTNDELSIVCLQSSVPQGVRSEGGWRCLRVAGAMDFSQVGILASLVGPLAETGISVFAVSTFDTDYLLVKEADFEKARTALREAGHTIQ